ncbi:MAG TPA: hypothetical protein VGX23_38385 [Actinocrinis sp.]|nr:hypothetical protein [Actinocrinis sp.]
MTGPDEYVGGVNDDAATDAGAVESLQDAITAARLVGVTPPSSWQQVATGLTATITDMQSSNGSHPEFQGYTNRTIKQADAILMTYPFGYLTGNSAAQADLDRYAPVTDPGGPAMTDSVESIIAAQIAGPGSDDYTSLKESVGPFTEGPSDQPFEFHTLGTDNAQGAFDFRTGAQVWQPQSNGSLLNPQSGRCLDDTGSGAGDTLARAGPGQGPEPLAAGSHQVKPSPGGAPA